MTRRDIGEDGVAIVSLTERIRTALQADSYDCTELADPFDAETRRFDDRTRRFDVHLSGDRVAQVKVSLIGVEEEDYHEGEPAPPWWERE